MYPSMGMGMGLPMGMGMANPMGMGPMHVPTMAMGPMGMPMPLIPGPSSCLRSYTQHKVYSQLACAFALMWT